MDVIKGVKWGKGFAVHQRFEKIVWTGAVGSCAMSISSQQHETHSSSVTGHLSSSLLRSPSCLCRQVEPRKYC